MAAIGCALWVLGGIWAASAHAAPVRFNSMSIQPDQTPVRSRNPLPLGLLPLPPIRELEVPTAVKEALLAVDAAEEALSKRPKPRKKQMRKLRQSLLRAREKAIDAFDGMNVEGAAAAYYALLLGDAVAASQLSLTYSDAITPLARATALDRSPSDIRVTLEYLQGVFYERQGHLDRAEAAYQRAVQSGRARVTSEVYHRLGDLAADRGDYEEAIEQYGLVAFGETRATALAKKAWAHWWTGDCAGVMRTADRFRREVLAEADRPHHAKEITGYEADCVAYMAPSDSLQELDPTGAKAVNIRLRKMRRAARAKRAGSFAREQLEICLARFLRKEDNREPVRLRIGGSWSAPKLSMDLNQVFVGEARKQGVEYDKASKKLLALVPLPLKLLVQHMNVCFARRLEFVKRSNKLTGTISLKPSRS